MGGLWRVGWRVRAEHPGEEGHPAGRVWLWVVLRVHLRAEMGRWRAGRPLGLWCVGPTQRSRQHQVALQGGLRAREAAWRAPSVPSASSTEGPPGADGGPRDSAGRTWRLRGGCRVQGQSWQPGPWDSSSAAEPASPSPVKAGAVPGTSVPPRSSHAGQELHLSPFYYLFWTGSLLAARLALPL